MRQQCATVVSIIRLRYGIDALHAASPEAGEPPEAGYALAVTCRGALFAEQSVHVELGLNRSAICGVLLWKHSHIHGV